MLARAMPGFREITPTVDMWVGKNGTYRVPEAISRLGLMANKHAGLNIDPSDWRQYRQWSQSPYFRVVEEWGNWRDNQVSNHSR